MDRTDLRHPYTRAYPESLGLALNLRTQTYGCSDHRSPQIELSYLEYQGKRALFSPRIL
jgi:hypothetical protein